MPNRSAKTSKAAVWLITFRSGARHRSILHIVFRPRWRLWLIEERGECLLLGEVHPFRLREYVCFGGV